MEFFKNSSHNFDRNCILSKQPASPIDIYNNKKEEKVKLRCVVHIVFIMAIRVVEISNGGY